MSDSNVEITIKNCPKCLVPTQKINGCNLMRCVCKTKWCWICNKIKANKLKLSKNKCSIVEHNSHS